MVIEQFVIAQFRAIGICNPTSFASRESKEIFDFSDLLSSRNVAQSQFILWEQLIGLRQNRNNSDRQLDVCIFVSFTAMNLKFDNENNVVPTPAPPATNSDKPGSVQH